MEKIKVLTGVRVAQTAGIAQVVFSFLGFIEQGKKDNLNVVAVDIINGEKETYKKVINKKTGIISITTKVPQIGEVVKKAKNINEVQQAYEQVIACYQKAIRQENPDLVLVNGTFFMPWCLLIAAERENIPAVLHYHGVLTKEVVNWPAPQRKIFLAMEKTFDKKNLFYIFPSQITKQIVEKEVFGHKIKRAVVLANPVSEHFFTEKNKRKNMNIGIVSRWTGIKNIAFCKQLAKYNHKNGSKFVLNVICDLKPEHVEYKKLAKYVKFHKPKSNKKLASFYRNMSVVISPSHFETYGNVAKESIACGTPAIVSCNMGVSETFNKLGLQDWVISFDSVEDVYEKIENVMGETVHADIKNKLKESYAPHKIFGQIVSTLNSVLI